MMGAQLLLYWGITAVFALLILSFIIWKSALPAQFLAYGSALTSFAAAAAASWKTVKQEGRRLLLGLGCAAFLSMVLLGIGALISERAFSHDAVMSVISFTVVGALAGSMLAPQSASAPKRHPTIKRRHQKRKLT